MLKPLLATLPPAQRRLYPLLAPSVQAGLTLYGGTALALRLGHRVSEDFDFFTEKPVKSVWIYELFPFLKKAAVLQSEENTLSVSYTASASEGSVHLSFFGGINFGRVGETDRTEDGVLRLASPSDLFGTKCAVLTQRVEVKDYRDIAALLRSGLTLETGLAAASALYGEQFSPVESLRAMQYLEGKEFAQLPEKDKKLLLSLKLPTRDIHPLPIRSLSLA